VHNQPYPFAMALHVPDETLSLMAEHLHDDMYCSRGETDLFYGTLLLWGDSFRARTLDHGEYQLESIVAPSCMRHFQMSLPNYVMSSDIKTPQARKEAIQDLGQMLDGLYGTPDLRQFLRSRSGACHYWDFFMVAEFFIHIPRDFADELLQSLPALCPGVDMASVTELFSGQNAELL
jgi:hypothetical protein